MTRRCSLPDRGVRAAVFAVVALLGTGVDQLTKEWAEGSLRGEPGWTRTVIDPHLDLALSYNQGTAFNLVGDLGQGRVGLGVVALAIVAGLLVVAVRSTRQLWMVCALGTIAAGALGNGLDRMFRSAPSGGTAVIDFIRVNYPWGGSWPAFNVSDALLVVGILVVLVATLVAGDEPTEAPGPARG